MDAFPADSLFYLVFFLPGEPSLVLLLGRGAQALVEDPGQLLSILQKIGVREQQFEVESRHPEVLLLHAPSEPCAIVAKYYQAAVEMVTDLWDQTNETPMVERSVALPAIDAELSPLLRPIEPVPHAYLYARFPVEDKKASQLSRARALCAIGRYERCRQILTSLLAEDPDSALLHYHLGSVLSRFLGQAEQGLLRLRRAAELAPEQPYIHGALAAALSSRGQDEEARQALARQVELNQAVDRELARQSVRRRRAEILRGVVLGLGFAGCTLAGGYLGSRQLDDQSGWSVVVFIVSLIAGMLLSPALLLPLSLVLEEWQGKLLNMPPAPGDSPWLELSPDDLENPIIKAALAEQQAKAPNADA